jgi:LacI family transcriptional regulator
MYQNKKTFYIWSYMYHTTVKDIARKLNVSVSTVSRAFNDKDDIKKETRELILKTATEMGYCPNPIAKKLFQRRSYNVGVIVPEFINSFFTEVIIGIQNVFLKRGYQVLIMQSNENSNTELDNIKKLEHNFVDGIILSLSKESYNTEYLSSLIEREFPIVLFNRVSDSLHVSKVVFDDYKWAFFATEHLLQQGFKNIIHLSGPKNITLSNNRTKGFIDAHRKFGKNVSSDQIIETGFYIADGEKIMNGLIHSKNLPDGIFAVNDTVAFGAMKALKRNGIKIPQDIGIVGFSETPMAELVQPSLTSVVQPLLQMGEVAAELLLKQIESNSFNFPETVILNGRLNVRESSVKI